MRKKFARIRCVGNSRPKRGLSRVWALCAKIEVTEASILDAEGYDVTLPVSAEAECLPRVFGRALETVAELGARVILPIEFGGAALEEVSRFRLALACGHRVWPFLTDKLALGMLARGGVALKYAEFLIIAGGDGLALQCVNKLRGLVNFMTVAVDEQYAWQYRQQAAEIFDENGLTIFITGKSYDSVKNADIVINASGDGRYGRYCGRGAAYIDLRAPDAVRSVNVQGEPVKPEEFDAVMMIVSRPYRLYASRGYDAGLCADVERKLEYYHPEVIL
ncbi:MAG: hypothetical protein LBS62_03160 [Clostridiales bacterium]|jgi:hypothetical protein|nr:hypothetical protein [Clostridiales bacterium]